MVFKTPGYYANTDITDISPNQVEANYEIDYEFIKSVYLNMLSDNINRASYNARNTQSNIAIFFINQHTCMQK